MEAAQNSVREDILGNNTSIMTDTTKTVSSYAKTVKLPIAIDKEHSIVNVSL